MATYKSAEDVRREHIERLGQELGEVFHALYQEIAWLQDKWREYRTVFTTSDSRIELLNEAAPRFFVYLQDTLWEDILLHISRLTDAAEMGKKANLTVMRLPDLIGSAETAARVRVATDAAVAAAAFARDWRNRYIAHRDLPLALQHDVLGLMPARQLSVQAAVDTLTAVVRLIYLELLDSDVSLDIPGGPGDAEDLLLCLRDGVEASRARELRFQSGKLVPEDLAGPRAV